MKITGDIVAKLADAIRRDLAHVKEAASGEGGEE
jgi:hypothetical protein